MVSGGALKRLWRNLPLHQLEQGAKLTIRSQVPSLQVHIDPGWRDQGFARLEQVVFAPNPLDVQLVVNNLPDTESSLGRKVPHLKLDIMSVTSSSSIEVDEPADDETVKQQDPLDSIPLTGRQTKEVNKIMLEDGTIQDIQGNVVPLPPVGSQNRVDYHDGVAHLTSTHRESSKTELANILTIQTPESTNLDIEIVSGDIHVRGKVEGDVQLKTGDGDIVVNKLRGHVVCLENEGMGNLIHASSLLEARDLSIVTPGRFRAQQCHGTNITVSVGCHDNVNAVSANEAIPIKVANDSDDEGSLVDIGALFVTGDNGSATVQVTCQQRLARRAVRIKSNHGAVLVDTRTATRLPPMEVHPHTGKPFPLVELGGVNGCCEVACYGIQEAVTSLDEQKNDSVMDSWDSCLVHVDSLLSDRINVVVADHGSIGLTLDRKIETDVRLASLHHSVAEAAATVAEEDDAELILNILKNLPVLSNDANCVGKNNETIRIATDSFVDVGTQHVSSQLAFRQGEIRNKSEEPDSRYDRKGAGKINVDAAADQAFAGFVSQNEQAETQRSLIAAIGTRQISVETLSWIGAIARRYGLDDSADRDLGRTASRRGRDFSAE